MRAAWAERRFVAYVSARNIPTLSGLTTLSPDRTHDGEALRMSGIINAFKLTSTAGHAQSWSVASLCGSRGEAPLRYMKCFVQPIYHRPLLRIRLPCVESGDKNGSRDRYLKTDLKTFLLR